MDLYRYFHPHHNPRLRAAPLRLQEVAELQQAAIELTRALKRAQLRMSRIDANSAEQMFTTAITAANQLVAELVETTNQFPDDDLATMKQLLNERRNAPGWETWTELLSQRLLLEELEHQLHLPEAAAKRGS